MPNLSAESEPLRRLLNLPDNEFCWGVDKRTAYETLKQMLTSEKLLQYYDSRKPIVTQTDASTAGLGAVLLQEDKPVAYASRSLSKTELGVPSDRIRHEQVRPIHLWPCRTKQAVEESRNGHIYPHLDQLLSNR